MSSEQAPQTKEATPQAAATPYALYSPGQGKPFEPYTGPLPPPEDYVAASPDRTWEYTKIALHCLGIVMSIVGIATCFSVHSDDSSLVVVGAAPCLILALAWSIAEITTRAIRKWKAGIHPGAHVGMSLIIWLTGAVLGVLFGIVLGISSFDQCAYQRVDGGWYNEFDEPCRFDSSLPAKKRIAITAAVFTDLVALMHFVLFIGACIDTHKRNRAASRPIIMVAHPKLLAEGWQPVQQTTPVEPSGKAPERQQGQESHEVVEHYAPGSSSAV